MTILNMVGGSSGGGGGNRPFGDTITVEWTEASNPADFNPIWSDGAEDAIAGDLRFDEWFGYEGVLLDGSGHVVKSVTQEESGGWGYLDITKLGTLTGTANNVMIKFPMRGLKMSKSGSKVTLSLTKELNKTGYQYYAFTKGTTIRNALYLGAYKGSFSSNDSTVASSFSSSTTKLKSRATGVRTANFSPATSQTRANFRASASNNGTGYSLITIYPRWYINCLMMMKYGNPYSQSIIGAGYTKSSNTQSIEPGTTNSQTSATYGTSDDTKQIKMFGLEDRWGNVFEYLDGCWFNASKNLTVDKTNSVFQDDNYATNLGVAQSGYLAGIDGSNDGMFRNISTSGGSGTSYYTDNSRSYASRVLTACGYRNSSADAGAFCVDHAGVSYSSSFIGGRLMFL